ncbi:hypothetical protein CYMTET_12611 [Cymbomonas tetramitiformis]|uniref:Uncharacterized protein n=1 Tax=Cymbomonas tetramitiformis TaxID=36881 RepID=A0AAE0GLC6_9CHLO|nr:hypothetical protein CYMTET_12611 [Cymbomonas tetramitiformis]
MPGVAAGGVDVSACYGFSVGESEDSNDEEMDVQECGSCGGTSGLSSGRHPVSSHAAVISPPTEEFSGGVELQPVSRRFEACMAPTFFAESSFVEYVGYASAGRPLQVVGCGVPPFGLLPNFLLRACLMGLLCFGIAGVAAGFGGMSISNDDNSVTEDLVMCIGTIYSGVDQLSPETRQQVVVIGARFYFVNDNLFNMFQWQSIFQFTI